MKALELQIAEMLIGQRTHLDFETPQECLAFRYGFNLAMKHPELGPADQICNMRFPVSLSEDGVWA